MERHALVLILAGAAALFAGCSKQPESPPTVPPGASQPEAQAGKKRIPDIEKLSLEEVKRYYDECMEFGDIGHAKVPYVAGDCRLIRARWDRRDMQKQSTTKSAPNLPTIK